MFGNKNNEVSNEIDTLIGKNTKLEGIIQAKGTVRLDGNLNGDLVVNGDVIIGEGGKVTGNITCNNVLLSGFVKGNIKTKEQLRVTSSGKLYGDINVNNFVVDENAIFEGSCKMKESTTTTDNSKKSLENSEKGSN